MEKIGSSVLGAAQPKPVEHLRKSNEIVDEADFLSTDGHTAFKYVGGKGFGLGELVKAGVEVPPFFVVNTNAFDAIFKDAEPEIKQILKGINYSDNNSIEAASHQIRRLMDDYHVSPKTRKLLEGRLMFTGTPVAVRSSATIEDLAGSAVAGIQETALYVNRDDLVDKTKHVMSSVYLPRGISYRGRNLGLPLETPKTAVVVQKQINSVASGVMFTSHPAGFDKMMDERWLHIESSWGQGESVVSGSVTPDSFDVKPDGTIINENIASKETEYVPKPGGGTMKINIEGERKTMPSLSPQQLQILAEYGEKIRRYFGKEMDTEFAIDENGKVYMLQARPQTALT